MGKGKKGVTKSWGSITNDGLGQFKESLSLDVGGTLAKKGERGGANHKEERLHFTKEEDSKERKSHQTTLC